MSDQNFKVKNGLNLGSSGVIDYNPETSKLRFSNDGGSTFSDLGSGGSAEVSTKTANYTLALADANNIIEMNVASANTVTVPGDDTTPFPIGSRIDVTQIGTGQTEFVRGSVVTPSNVETWSAQTSNFGSYAIRSAAFGNNLWVIAGGQGSFGNRIRTSTDAVTWVTRNANFGSTVINAVAFGDGTWVAVGGSGQVRTSTDAITWVTRVSNFGSDFGAPINSVVFGGGTWVIAGYAGRIRTSTDAITWVTRTSNVGRITAMAYGNNLWVGLVDGTTTTVTSTDSINWTSRNFNFGTTIRCIAFGAGTWVIGTNPIPGIFVSTDAVTWTSRNSNFGATVATNAVAFGGGQWVATGYFGEARTSTDTVTWVTRNINFSGVGNRSVRSVAYGNGTWVLAGDQGAVSASFATIGQVGLLSQSTSTKISERYGTVSLYKRAANTWVLEGDLADEPQTKTASYTLALADAESTIKMNVGSANTVTVPSDSSVNFPIGSLISIIQEGAGQTEIVAASGVTLLSKNSSRRIAVRYGTASLYKRAANTWVLFGDLGA